MQASGCARVCACVCVWNVWLCGCVRVRLCVCACVYDSKEVEREGRYNWPTC